MRAWLFLLILTLTVGFDASARSSREAYRALLSKLERDQQSRWLSTTLHTAPYLGSTSVIFHGETVESAVQSTSEWLAFVEAAINEISATSIGRAILDRHARPLAVFSPRKYERHFGLWYTKNTPKPEDSVNLLGVYGYTFNNNYSLLLLDGRDLSYNSFMATFVHEFMATEDGKLALQSQWEDNNNTLAKLTKNLVFPFRAQHVQLNDEARDILASPMVAYGLAALRDYEMERLLNTDLGFTKQSGAKTTGACLKTLRQTVDDLWPAWDLVWQYLTEVARVEALFPSKWDYSQLAAARYMKLLTANSNEVLAKAMTEQDLERLEKATVVVDGKAVPLCNYFAEPLIAPENAFLGAGPRPRGSGWYGEGE